MERIYNEIESGAFAQEWASPLAKLRFRVVRFFAMRQKINRIERQVRSALGLSDVPEYLVDPKDEALLDDPAIHAELETFKNTYEY
jgi:hypothetical protein